MVLWPAARFLKRRLNNEEVSITRREKLSVEREAVLSLGLSQHTFESHCETFYFLFMRKVMHFSIKNLYRYFCVIFQNEANSAGFLNA